MNLLKKVKDYCKQSRCSSCEMEEICDYLFDPTPCNWMDEDVPSFDYQEVINHYGNNAQIAITQEELAELIQSLSKSLRTDVEAARDSVLEELGDVTLCLEYIKLIFGITEKDIKDQVKLKQDRLLKEMNK